MKRTNKTEHIIISQQEKSIEACAEKECTVKKPLIENCTFKGYISKEPVDEPVDEPPLTPEASTEEFSIVEELFLTPECTTKPENASKGDFSSEICPDRVA
ncbi:hypothetical protein DM02DRAFT_662284 [Periconia macrospinosa]|uniref:Uncharacterized protein n=1 Tax=Periconia macrospinosa TaxID=97972 RepID=A0A2V1D506_9PLEO|nr:hypothetical protein DM02DRAFT_662284 [Periconia macrospinosa]